MAWPSTSQAQFGFGGGEIVYDPSNFAKNTITAAEAIKTVALLTRALEGITFKIDDGAQVLAAVREALLIANAIHYRLSNPSEALRRRYPGYDYELTPDMVWYDDEEQAIRAEMATLEALLATQHEQLSERQEQQDLATLGAILGLSEVSQGIRAAVQLDTQAAVFQGQQLLRLRQSVGALLNLHAVTMARQAHERAVSQKLERELLERSIHPIPRSVMR
jgi:P-type conjugative transfer protein TrbJ